MHRIAGKHSIFSLAMHEIPGNYTILGLDVHKIPENCGTVTCYSVLGHAQNYWEL